MKIHSVSPRRFKPRNLVLVQFDSGKYEDGSSENANHSAQGVKRLGEIEPALGILGIAQHRDERVGSRLKESCATGDHEQGKKKKGILLAQSRRPKEKGSGAIEKQTDHQSGLVPISSHHQGGGHRHKEISQEEGKLDQRRLVACKFKRLHELLNQNVIQVAGDTPEHE